MQLENNDISELDFIINGTDELAEDEELADFFDDRYRTRKWSDV